ncbi:hypothetical protein ACLI09_08635 [Flavobacterium sp. RHBU_24]|uniref:hypothetical protein n=1 Tax=Flavobacterium sp. RHBU_24 TaxID=3391185 RepID=UPI003984D7C9
MYTNGRRIAFADLHGDITVHFYERMLKDEVAMEALRHMEYQDALERFVYCLYGAADSTPDINDMGAIGPAENFNCGITGCNCSTWPSKKYP